MTDNQNERIANQAAAHAYALIRTRYEDVPVPERLFYHMQDHTKGVWERTRLIGQALGLSERELLLAEIAALFHDTVQRWKPILREGSQVVRQRSAGENEALSAAEAATWMAASEFEFRPVEIALVANAIIGTTPDWHVADRTVIQPLVTSTSHPITRALALADLGEAGMDTESFLESGRQLFAEDQLDLMELLATGASISEETAKRYHERYIVWLSTQPSFARGRKLRFEGEITNLGSATKRVRRLFQSFDRSIEGAEAAVEAARSQDFLRDIAPQLYPTNA